MWWTCIPPGYPFAFVLTIVVLSDVTLLLNQSSSHQFQFADVPTLLQWMMIVVMMFRSPENQRIPAYKSDTSVPGSSSRWRRGNDSHTGHNSTRKKYYRISAPKRWNKITKGKSRQHTSPCATSYCVTSFGTTINSLGMLYLDSRSACINTW